MPPASLLRVRQVRLPRIQYPHKFNFIRTYYFLMDAGFPGTSDHVSQTPEGRRTRLFNIGFAELMLVLVIAFLVVGPKDLPKVARWLGRTVKKLKQLIREVKEETGWSELEAEFNDTKTTVQQTVQQADIRKDLEDPVKKLQQELRDAKKDVRSIQKDVNESLKKD